VDAVTGLGDQVGQDPRYRGPGANLLLPLTTDVGRADYQDALGPSIVSQGNGFDSLSQTWGVTKKHVSSITSICDPRSLVREERMPLRRGHHD
jgi:hypothetical protein